MKKILLIAIASLFVSKTLFAQDVKSEIIANKSLSASNSLAYPMPKNTKDTPAPKGYKPCYLSHYGRHGSRFIIDKNDYLKPLDLFLKADAQHLLTPKGCEVLEKWKKIELESRDRYGELTDLGARQHQEIAERMYRRFPMIFSDSSCIEAKSTVVIRCILSMENELLKFATLNPRLKMKHDASHHDMYYMNLNDSVLFSKRKPKEVKDLVDNWENSNIHPQRCIQQLFTDTTFVAKEMGVLKLYLTLFRVASILQNSEVGNSVSLLDLFTNDELYALWQRNNIHWYFTSGPSPQNGGMQPFSQRNLLKNIMHQADSCLQLKHPGATLRFGHETIVLPLVCLLGINGHDKQIDSIDKLEQEGWVNYRIFPMAANVQLVFYRRSENDKDVLVKVLLNEQEATLPLPTKHAPYYRWSDFKNYYNAKLKSFKP
jgi:putative multiple inositol polyphosphate histidine phosphatase 1